MTSGRRQDACDIASQPLPDGVAELLQSVAAQPRLVAHLTLVHDAAVTLTQGMLRKWPQVQCDVPAVLFGTATHDIGKSEHPSELSGPGSRHEKSGEELLTARGYPQSLARFARTHGAWAVMPSPTLEDLLVALADHVWKGQRDEQLEDQVACLIAQQSGEELWQVWAGLDDILTAVGAHADERLHWQSRHQ